MMSDMDELYGVAEVLTVAKELLKTDMPEQQCVGVMLLAANLCFPELAEDDQLDRVIQLMEDLP